MLIKQTKKLPETIKTIWRLKELIAIVVAAIIAGGLFWWQRSTTGVLSLWLFWIAVSILGLTVLSSGVVLLLIPYRWNFWTYYLDERQIALHHGYFFRKQVIVPIARVQNVTLKQGPLLRLKSLQKVVIQTAAGSHEIDGLEMTQAEALKDQIMALAQEAKMTSKPKHQHPVALVAFFYRWAVTLVVPYTIVIAVSVRRFWIIASVFAGLVLVSLIGSFASYWLFRYQMLADEIVVKQGLFVKKVKHVPYDRIQNVETNQWFFLKPFHIESVSIETAGHSDGPEIDLEAVTTDFKKLLNQQRQKAQAKAAEVATETAPIAAAAPETPPVTPAMMAPKAQASYQISNRDLMKFAFTSPAFLSGFLAIFALYGKLGQTMQQKIFDVLFQTMAGLGMLILISLGLSVLLIFYIGSALVLIIRYYKFELVRQKTQFRLSSGLFKRKVMTIKLDRIQAVVIKQPLLRHWLGIATVKLVIISNSNQGETEKDVIMMPVLNRRSIPDFMARFLPSIPVAKVTPVQAAPRTYFYKLRNALLIFLPVALFSSFLFRRWWLLDLSWLLLMAVLWLIPAYLAAKRSGAQVLDATYVYVQNNQFFTLNQYFVPKNKIQAMLRKQSVWLAKRNFASLELQCRSGVGLRKIKANYLKDQMVTPVLAWYKQPK